MATGQCDGPYRRTLGKFSDDPLKQDDEVGAAFTAHLGAATKNAEPRAALLAGADPVVGDERLRHGSDPPNALLYRARHKMPVAVD